MGTKNLTKEEIEAKTTKAFKLIEDAHAIQKVLDAADKVRNKKEREVVPEDLWVKVRRIKSDAAKAVREEVAQLAAITEEAKKLVLELGESVKNEDHGTVSWCKGRDTADIPGLKGLALIHKEILPLLSTGEPFARLALKKD